MPKHKTHLSTKGQLVVPKAWRDELAWNARTELVIERQGDALLLRAAVPARKVTLSEVAGRLRQEGPAVSPAEMDAAIAEAFRAGKFG